MSNALVDGPDILSLGLSTLLIVGAVIALGWFYSRMRFAGGAGGDLIKVIASRAFGPKERLLLIEVADQYLLVGFTANGMQTLHTFDGPVTDESVVDNIPGFADRLRSALRGAAK